MNDERLKHARSVDFEPIDVKKSDKLEELIESVIGVPEVDASVDAVGFEARGYGAPHAAEALATVLNSFMAITRPACGIGIPGLYVTEDPGANTKPHNRATCECDWAWDGPSRIGSTPDRRRC